MINRSNILQFIIAYMDITVDTPTGYLNEQTHMKLKRCNSTKHRWMMDNGINSGTRYTYATWCFFVKTSVLKTFYVISTSSLLLILFALIHGFAMC